MPATDSQSRRPKLASAPPRNGAAVTPHDTDELTVVTSGIYVGGAGNVTVITVGGDTITFTALPVGSVISVQAKIIKSTLTTATNLLALW